MFKLLGCLCIFLGGVISGEYMASKYKNRRVELENIKELLQLLILNIDYRKEPLAKTFSALYIQKPCWYSSKLHLCSNYLKENKSLSDAWNNSILSEKQHTPILNSDIEILSDMMIGLGLSDSDGQKSIIQPAIIRIDQNLKYARDLEIKLGKMYRGIGIATALFIIIMII